MLAAYSTPEPGIAPLKEREQLLHDCECHYTAFSPRPGSCSAIRKSPSTVDTRINVRHKVRTPVDEQTIIFPLVNYQTWKDVGNMEPMIPSPVSTDYNSNIWRSFSAEKGYSFKADGRKVNELIASMYPISIPPPSRMGDYTYSRFIKYGDVMKTVEAKEKKITVTDRELGEMKRLNVLSEARVPPTDNKGRIVAPLELRRIRAQGRIKHRPITLSKVDVGMAEQKVMPFDSQLSGPASFASRSTSLRHKGLLWKFSYKQNNPVYEKVLNEQEDIRRWKIGRSLQKRMGGSKMSQQMITYY